MQTREERCTRKREQHTQSLWKQRTAEQVQTPHGIHMRTMTTSLGNHSLSSLFRTLPNIVTYDINGLKIFSGVFFPPTGVFESPNSIASAPRTEFVRGFAFQIHRALMEERVTAFQEVLVNQSITSPLEYVNMCACIRAHMHTHTHTATSHPCAFQSL